MDATGWDERYAATELVWSAEPNRFVAEELASLPPGRALDLACGEGRNAIWLAEHGWKARGVDFSQVALDKAAKLAERRGVSLDLERADLTRYVPTPRGYDLVLVAYLHVPWSELSAILERAADAVAPGGTLFLVGHDLDNLARGFGGPQDPAVLYSAAQVAGALRGLVIDKATQVERSVAKPDGPRIAIDNLVRAHRPSE